MVHDLAFEIFPSCYPDKGKRLRRITRHALSKADQIIAPSYSTKRDLIRLYGVTAERIKVVYLAADTLFKPMTKRDCVRIQNKYQLPKKYFLFVGAIKKSKNIGVVLEAFADYLTKSEKPVAFVLSGKKKDADESIIQTIKKNHLKKEVIFLEYVPQKDLPALFSGAKLFISPSLYEGFGIPHLEAMSCGCPVIAGNNSSQKEVVGDAGILINPKNPGEISKAMQRITSDKQLSKIMSKDGIERSQIFNWNKSAKELLQIIESL